MNRLLKFVHRIFKFSSPVRRPSLEITEAAEDENDLQENLNSFLKLPNELLLEVANFLDKESQVLLSLSCKRVRVLLSSSLDLSLCDMAVKLRFLQYLGLDHPEYLTCQSCGFLYKWTARRWEGYRCPRWSSHPLTDRLKSMCWVLQRYPFIQVTREVVDLIFRADVRGLRHGVSLSLLNTSETDYHGITRKNEARLVDGQLLVATRLEAGPGSPQDMAETAYFFNGALCLHFWLNVWRENWQSVEQAVADMTGLEKPELFKCPFCPCDHTLRVQAGSNDRMKIVLDVWRAYRPSNENEWVNEQIYYSDPSMRIDPDTLSRRDLRAMFESYRAGTDGGSL